MPDVDSLFTGMDESPEYNLFNLILEVRKDGRFRRELKDFRRYALNHTVYDFFKSEKAVCYCKLT